VRIYLAGRLMVENGTHVLDEGALPARQGRVAFAYLVLQRSRPVPRLELAAAIWGDETPETWDAGLSALLSRLRRQFRSAAVAADIETAAGVVSLELPPPTWVDLDEARSAIDVAEGALRSGDQTSAWSSAAVAVSILERGFLHGEDLPWVVKERERQRQDLLRGLECLAEIMLSQGQAHLSIEYCRRCLEIEPFRESAVGREMRAHIAMGNRAEALRAYERLRVMLADELGADPSPAVQAVYLEALGG